MFSCSRKYISFNENGTIKEKGEVCIKQKEIEMIISLSNDTLKVDTTIAIKKGLWTTYNKKGEITSKGRYIPKLIDVKYAYINNETLETVIIKTQSSQKNGKWLYYSNGNVLAVAYWRKGKRIKFN